MGAPEECSLSCLFFSSGLLKLDFNDTLLSSTHTFPVNIFNLEGGETMLARDKENFHSPGENRTRDPPVQWLERPIFIVDLQKTLKYVRFTKIQHTFKR